jgi:hypothetical protein
VLPFQGIETGIYVVLAATLLASTPAPQPASTPPPSARSRRTPPRTVPVTLADRWRSPFILSTLAFGILVAGRRNAGADVEGVAALRSPADLRIRG